MGISYFGSLTRQRWGGGSKYYSLLYILDSSKTTAEPNIITIYDIFACLITKSWLLRSSPEAASELLTLSCSLHAAAGELRDNQDLVIGHANMS